MHEHAGSFAKVKSKASSLTNSWQFYGPLVRPERMARRVRKTAGTSDGLNPVVLLKTPGVNPRTTQGCERKITLLVTVTASPNA